MIYKEAELDIDPEAGGTDLCPFDCECCKFLGGQDLISWMILCDKNANSSGF